MNTVVVLDRPGAVLQGATVHGGIRLAADRATVRDVRVVRSGDLVAPAAFTLGALIGALVWRWSR